MKNIKQYGYNLGRDIHNKTTNESTYKIGNATVTELQNSIEEMLDRRMTLTGETREQSVDHIVRYLKGSH